jgi:ABC-type transport system involved in multi-copper enzyme maturation permease subunit
MVLTIVRKELRETRLFAALAVGLYVIYLCQLTGKGTTILAHTVWWVPGMNVEPPDVPFVQDNFSTMLFFIGATLAITLGFRQSAWEPSQGTALYLLHLPLTRRTIFLTKLLTGIGLLLACTLLPILIYGVWAAMPGTHPGPFEWSMTEPAIRVWLLMPLVYLGAFASGIRPARWFGSRLLPLLSVAFTGTLLVPLAHWRLIAFAFLLLAAAVLVSNILWEAENRDF